MLIKSYAQFWNPDVIDWSSRILLGEVNNKKKHTINFWNSKGIYVLHSDFKAIYVGKAFRTSIGKRVSEHLCDRFAGRWDMFSWFSVSSPRFTQKDVSQPGQRQLKPDTIVSTLEALAILIADPSLNRKRESLKNAFEATQPKNIKPKTIRTYLQEIYSKLETCSSARGDQQILQQTSLEKQYFPHHVKRKDNDK